MASLKCLLTTYSTAFVVSGGGESELVQAAEILNSHGISADVYGTGSRPMSFYDVVMHFSVHENGCAILQDAVRRKKRVVLWPNVWWSDKPKLSEIDRVAKMVAAADTLIFKSQAELDNFTAHITIPKKKAAVISGWVSNRFLAPADEDLAATICAGDNFALSLGLIEPIKNQLHTIQALNRLHLNGVFIGGPRHDGYYRACVEEAHPGILFLPFMQPCSAMLRSIIKRCAVMVEPSFDPPGRSALEGAVMRRPLVLNDGPWQREHFADGVWYSGNGSVNSIISAIQAASVDCYEDARVGKNHDRVLEKYSEAVIGPMLSAAILSGVG